MSRLLDFYLEPWLAKGPETSWYGPPEQDPHRQQSLWDLWELEDWEWEIDHHFIQWLLPTRQESAFNSEAPVVTALEELAFKESLSLQTRLYASYLIFLQHLGLADTGSRIVVVKRKLMQRNVLQPSHHWLRITRCLSSLRCLSQVEASARLYDWLRQVEGIAPETQTYWALTQKEKVLA